MAPCSEFVVFEAEVRRQFTAAQTKLREMGKKTPLNDMPICRAVEAEEQSRVVAFQQCLMGGLTEAYQSTVQCIIQNILGNLAVLGGDPSLFQGATQCLSDYMSALNHHSSICVEEPEEERGLEVGFGGTATPGGRRGSMPACTGSPPNAKSSPRRASVPVRQSSGNGSSVRSPYSSTSGAHQKLSMLPPGVSEDTDIMPTRSGDMLHPFRRFGQAFNWVTALTLSAIFGYVLFEFSVNGAVISALERSRTWRATGCLRQGEPELVMRRLFWGRGHLDYLGSHSMPLMTYRLDVPVTLTLHGHTIDATAHRYPSGRFWEADTAVYRDGIGPVERFKARLLSGPQNVTCWYDSYNPRHVMLSRDEVPAKSRSEAESSRLYSTILIGPASLAMAASWWMIARFYVRRCADCMAEGEMVKEAGALL